MTIGEQLREIARHADERPITVEEIVQRASRSDLTLPGEPSRHLRARRPGRAWLVAAAAVIVVAAVAVFAMHRADDSAVRTDTASLAPSGFPIRPGSIAFAADAGAGPAFTDPVEYPRVETRPQPMDIYITRSGEPVRRLTSDDEHERCPSFSPDGERLAYLSVPRSGDPSIVILGISGATVLDDPQLRVRLPAVAGYGVKLAIGYPCPAWSPDSSQLAYLAYPADPDQSSNGISAADAAELRVVSLDGQERVVNPGWLADSLSPFAWSAAGTAIAYARDDGVWAADLDGRAPVLLWRPDGTPSAVSWSSRGELAVTVVTEVPADGGFRRESSVHIVEVGGRSETLAESIHEYDGVASWSPDGSQLAFVSQDGRVVLRDRDDPDAAGHLSPPRVDDDGIGLWDVAWTPDGERLLALARSETRGLALIALSPEGAADEVLTPWSWALDWINLRDVSWQTEVSE